MNCTGGHDRNETFGFLLVACHSTQNNVEWWVKVQSNTSKNDHVGAFEIYWLLMPVLPNQN